MIREKKIDVLKFIGLFCIILAHVNPPQIIFQIRNFDVVLMILLSAYLFLRTKKNVDFKQYAFKRFKRLILPTWFFLTIFFFIAYIFKLCDINLGVIVSSFLLSDGIGYVWIIRIYFILALLLPTYKKMSKIYSKKIIIYLLLIIYILYEILCFLGIFKNLILMYAIAYIVPCFVLIFIAEWIFKSNNKKLAVFCFANCIIFIITAILIYKVTGDIKNTNYFKYPFQSYYLSYALFVSSFLIIIFRTDKITDFCYNSYIEFVSKNSLYFYLWHILFVYIVKELNFNWLLKYILIIFFTSIIVYFQSKVVEFLEKTSISPKIISILKG